MYKQKILNPKSFPTSPESFYKSKSTNGFKSFEAYFNVLDYTRLIKFCGAKNFYIETKYEGSILINVCLRTLDNKKIILKQITDTSGDFKSDVIDLQNLPEYGYIFLDVKCKKLFDLTMCVPTEQENKVSVAIVICTYKREKYVLNNLKNFSKYCRDSVDRIFVIDNGKTLENYYRDDELITILPNKNLGGSGGFSRGMYEAFNAGYTHMFLMDDDISVHPESIKRAVDLIKNFNENHKDDWVGFSMFPFDRPTRQHELGSNWDGRNVRSNKWGYDLSKHKYLVENLEEKPYQYSAWWSLLMPTSLVKKQGLSLPLFIKMDDIEYALRRDGGEIYFSNGLGVWHESFDSKYNVALEYYIYRNALIVNAIHLKRKIPYCIYRFFGKTINNVFHGRLHEQELYNLALRHFLKGPKLFDTLDGEANHKKIGAMAKTKHINFFFAISILFKSGCLLIKSIFVWRKSTKHYKKEYNRISSIEHWKKMLQI